MKAPNRHRLLAYVLLIAGTGLSRAEHPVDLVAPLAGTVQPRFDYFAAASLPFGMVALSPDTKHGDLWNSGYRYHDQHILCFSHIHNIQLAGIPVMPSIGPCRGHLGMKANQATFSRETEVVKPGYHRVELTDRKITAELTATCRVGLHRYTFPETAEAHLLMDLGEPIGMTSIEHASINRVSDHEITGEVVMSPTFRRKVPCTVYFVARTDRAIDRFGGWLPDGNDQRVPVEVVGGSISGIRSGAHLTFHDVKQGERIQFKVALSYVSIPQARKNLDAELPGWDFGKVSEDARAAWSRHLDRIRVSGGTREQRVKFYTDLFRTGIGKRIYNDVDGRYTDRGGPSPVVRTLPLDDRGRPRFNLLDMDCLWGSQWNLNLLWLLAWPDVARDVAESFLELLAALACNGRVDFDLNTAYQATRKNAFPGGVRDRSGYEAVAEPTGGGMPDYVKLGYVPVEVQQRTTGWHSGGTALTLEYAWQDWCLMHLARMAGARDDVGLFAQRAQNFRHVFDPESGWMRPRHEDGSWMADFTPVAHDDRQSPGFIEGCAAHYSFHVPQDVGGLISMMGGAEKFIARLNDNFTKAEPTGFRTPHGGHSKGWVEYGNQPSGGMAHLFSHAGAPWLTQHWVRKVHQAMFSSPAPNGGYNGDEDQGQLGALSALMSIGLFDVQGGVGEKPDWELTSPLFDEVLIRVGEGKSLTLRTRRVHPDDSYIQSASFNGRPVAGFAVPAAELLGGGLLEIELGGEPNKKWGAR
jgi:putative alpha-1,2-mannosidase